jgi:hypothetical protein
VSGSADCVRRLAGLAGVAAEESSRSFDWAAIEVDLGVRLPADYKLLAESFPGGWFRGWVRVRLPERTGDDRPRLLSDFAAGELEALREFRETGECVFPFPLFPEPGGVLPWGYLRSPGVAYWLTGPGDPDEWPVIAATADGDYWERFDGPACEFLTEVAAGRYDASGFPDDYRGHGDHRIDLAPRPVFEPDSAVPPPAVQQVPPLRQILRQIADFWPMSLQRAQRPVSEMAALRELIGAPPTGVRAVDWAGLHARLGFRLPADYREFIDTYGPGTLGDIQIMAPGAPGGMDLFELLEWKYAQVREADRDLVFRPPFYPEPGGTVCWGEASGRWTCGWAPGSADPDEWTVVIMPNASLASFSHEDGLSFSAMLRHHAQQDAFFGLLPLRDPAAGPVTFTPYKPAI